MKRLAFLLVFAAVGTAGAGERKPAAVIAPFVDDNTFAVIRIDAARVRPQEIIRRVEQFLGANAPEDRNDLPKLHGRFVSAGAKELFVIFNMADGGNHSIVVVPLAAD